MFVMKNRNNYSPDFKLQVVKEYLSSDIFIRYCNMIPSSHTLHDING